MRFTNTNRRRIVRRRRKPVRKINLRRNFIFRNTKIYRSKQIVHRSTVNTTGGTIDHIDTFIGASSNTAFVFNLNDLYQVVAWSSLFHLYRIRKVSFRLVPTANFSNVASAVDDPGYALTVIDYDDGNALTTESDYLNYNNCKRHKYMSEVVRTFTPKFRMASYAAGSVADAVIARPNKADWLNMADPNISHYSIKLYLSPSVVTVLRYQIFITYFVEFSLKK